MDEKRLDGQTKSMDDVGISARLLAKQCDIRSLCVSTERSLHDLNDTLWCAIFVIQTFEFDSIFKKVEFSYLLFLLNIVIFICFSYKFLW